ncbi:DUF808 domain-containing protein [Neptunicella marina]|uniref:DUF808 domain-containing protein n=1 Tax=Neptunicella marina TaxID=2125989 RepID=A0A8J6IYI1_9ALTE|nr:DUF808 domain-containing protein [Neptunicella marina]MBC3767433.1 DUF808 domain-containing protein [Neptunicella marina]
MAGASLLTLLDDIAAVLDDVALMSKVAAKKTAGVLGDDLALNADQVSGVRAERELPVVWAVAKGSFLNKVILVPVALLLSYFLPWLITPLLLLGGLYLCFEGVEKLLHHPSSDQQKQQEIEALSDANIDLVQLEKQKIKGAIRTDFILSAEIIVIALGTVAESAFATQALVVSLIAIAMTAGVYGLVAAIVKLDDIGLFLLRQHQQQTNNIKRVAGRFLISFAPRLMKFLSIAGTAAMFLVGGGIVMHALPFLHHIKDIFPVQHGLFELLINLVCGLIAGAIVLSVVSVGQKLFVSQRTNAS